MSLLDDLKLVWGCMCNYTCSNTCMRYLNIKPGEILQQLRDNSYGMGVIAPESNKKTISYINGYIYVYSLYNIHLDSRKVRKREEGKEGEVSALSTYENIYIQVTKGMYMS